MKVLAVITNPTEDDDDNICDNDYDDNDIWYNISDSSSNDYTLFNDEKSYNAVYKPIRHSMLMIQSSAQLFNYCLSTCYDHDLFKDSPSSPHNNGGSIFLTNEQYDGTIVNLHLW